MKRAFLSILLPLAESLLVRICGELGRPPLRLDDSVGTVFRRAPWSGNVRELANVLERAAILAEGERLGAEDLSLSLVGARADPAHQPARTMAEMEEAAIREALEVAGGHRKKAAEALGIGERTLYDKLRQYGIR
ncbi:MAG: helix-turn-helix domain-containing protein [Gemmatimonadota bacterium]